MKCKRKYLNKLLSLNEHSNKQKNKLMINWIKVNIIEGSIYIIIFWMVKMNEWMKSNKNYNKLLNSKWMNQKQ